MSHTYLTKALEIVKRDPWLFIRQRLGKMFFVWEKHFLFYYQESPNSIRDILVYWGNITLLIFGLSGLIVWSRKKIMLLSVVYFSFIAYISFIHSVSLAEDRYSLPGYPLLVLFAGYTLVSLMHFISYHVPNNGEDDR